MPSQLLKFKEYMPSVILTGASGMIGKALQNYLIQCGYAVKTLVRDKKKADGINSFFWDYHAEEIDLKVFETSDYIIHLAGANVSKRWTFKYKKEIYDSRIMSTDFLFKIIKSKNIRIKKMISISGTGYYGDTTTLGLNENSPTGNDFLAMVCRDWENSAKQMSSLKIPVCIFRLGVVMSPKGGFLKRIATPIKYFVGVHLGDAQQMLSWLSIHDLCRLFVHAIEKNLVGTYNATASLPITLEQIDNTLAAHLHRKIVLPNIPEWILKLVLGEMSTMILTNCHASNEKIKNTGFAFEDENFSAVLKY